MFCEHGNTIVQMIQMILQFTWVNYDDYEFYDQVVCAQIESFTSLKVGIKSLDDRSTWTKYLEVSKDIWSRIK